MHNIASSISDRSGLATLTAKTLAEVDEWWIEMQLEPFRLGRVELCTSVLNPANRATTGVHLISDLHAAVAASIA